MHKHPSFDAVGEDDDDKPLNQRRDDLTKLVTHKLRLLALLLRVHDMHPFVELVSTPRIVQHKQRGNDNQRKGWLELSNHPTDYPANE